VSKQTLLAHVSEVGGPDHGGKLHGFEEASSASCEKLFAGETIVAPEVKEAALAWVPEAMRFRAIAASDTEDEQPIEAGGEPSPEGEVDELEASEDQETDAAEPVDA
jgi:ParB family chromosome partitioning protein